MNAVRLPLQLGRAALNQGARFAAFVWLGPLLLILAAMFAADVTVVGVLGLGLAAIFAMALAVDANDTARRDRAADIVLDAKGFAVEGGPLDGTRCAWSDVDPARCEIVDGEPRVAVRWLVLSWLTGRQIAAITKRARVTVRRLELTGAGKDGEPLVLAEAEGDELGSLAQLRDSIRAGAAAAAGAGATAGATAVADAGTREPPAPLPQEILRCPGCGAPQVPADAATMTCAWCSEKLTVPTALRERVRASADLARTSRSRGAMVRKLVDQPSARRAGRVVAWCRRLMVWIQPAALVVLVALLYRQTHGVELPDGIGVGREAPSDDFVFLYDLALLALVIAAAFGIAWSVGHAYVANRRALRLLADHFGAVPPAKPGAPSTCRGCGAPLPAPRDATELLVHCVYCAAENILGVDPRPAALRRRREHAGLVAALRGRLVARVRMALVIPVSALLAFAMIREVRLASWVPEHEAPTWSRSLCTGHCGSLTNADPVRRTFFIVKNGKAHPITVLPHGEVSWTCGVFSGCDIELGATRIATEYHAGDPPAEARIERGALRAVAR